MIYKSIDIKKINKYRKGLKVIGSLSKLYSTSSTPYLSYRVAERIYCNSFEADDKSRSDLSIDATLDEYGIGLKTFLHTKPLQKIAEFNALINEYSGLNIKEQVRYISEARNKRIESTKSIFGSEKMIYHLVARKQRKFLVYETEMSSINIKNIRNVKEIRNQIKFNDKKFEYSFNPSKSTLSKKFILDEPLDSIDIVIFDDPLEYLASLDFPLEESIEDLNEVILPLYITSGKDYREVQKKSGLNQFNARGRGRNQNEVYIPVPRLIHNKFPGFFPNSKDVNFKLILPNKKELSAKLCQDGLKSLMSNPNKELGYWLLRDVLRLKPGELATRKHLNKIGIDCVRVVKLDSKTYQIDFGAVGQYEEFIENISK